MAILIPPPPCIGIETLRFPLPPPFIPAPAAAPWDGVVTNIDCEEEEEDEGGGGDDVIIG
jgi:hypothetical protein